MQFNRHQVKNPLGLAVRTTVDPIDPVQSNYHSPQGFAGQAMNSSPTTPKPLHIWLAETKAELSDRLEKVASTLTMYVWLEAHWSQYRRNFTKDPERPDRAIRYNRYLSIVRKLRRLHREYAISNSELLQNFQRIQDFLGAMDKGQIFETGRLMSLVVDEHGHNRLLEKITVMEEKGRAFVEGERLSEQLVQETAWLNQEMAEMGFCRDTPRSAGSRLGLAHAPVDGEMEAQAAEKGQPVT